MDKNNRIPVVILNDTSKEGHIGCVGVMAMFRDLCKENSMKIVRTFSRNKSPKKIKSEISNLGAKLVLVNGEGTLHRSGTYWNNCLLSLPKNIPAVLVNTVWDKMFVEKKDLDRFKFITVRESLSKEELLKLKSDLNVEVIPDILFRWKKKNSFAGYGDSVMDLVNSQLCQETNYFPVNNAYVPDVVAYISWLSSLGIYVTGRFHGVVLAALAKTPFVVFPSNSHKIEGLLKDMDCEELLISSVDEVQDKIKVAKKCLPKVEKYCEEAKKRIEHLGRRLKGVCLK